MKKREKRRSGGILVGRSQLSVINRLVAGIDIGSREMFVCGPENLEGSREVRVFATTTQQILECVRWLKERKVESVALESTGVYWIPVVEILESRGMDTLLVDPGPLSRVPGRNEKTDNSDCQWIQTLHSHGLLRGSFRPSEQVGELRTIVRQKATLVREQADWIRRMQKCLDQMNVRVHHAVTQTQGVTGIAILRAIVEGERDPRKLAALRDRGCHKSEAEMVDLLTGHWRADHLFNLTQHMTMYDTLSQQLAVYEEEIQRRMQELTPPERKDTDVPAAAKREKQKTLKRRGQEGKRQTLCRMIGADLTSIDGIGVETAEVIITEYGTDMSKFPSEKKFVKHIGLAPHRPVSGGKVLKKPKKAYKSTRTAEVLRNAAAALKNSHSALGAYYRRMARRKDGSIAVFATARKLAEMIYRMLRYGQAYVDAGQAAYEKHYEETKLHAMKNTAKQMGYMLLKQEATTA
jgi:transposase